MGEVLFMFSIIVIFIIFTIIVSEVFFPIKGEGNKLSDIGIRGLTTLGILLIIIAVIMPFRVRNYFKSRLEGYETIADLGTIGDFIGGTTVAFLTAASVVLLLATIIMQRKEIKISQESIVQLVKQTEASVQQAEEARKETKITNETMKRQQFETTFFNMINLHHKILNEIKVNDSIGRDAIKHIYADLEYSYFNHVYKKYSEDLKKEALMGDELLLDDLVEKVFIDDKLSLYKDEFYEHYSPSYDKKGFIDNSKLDKFLDSLENGTNEEWNRRKKKHLKDFEERIKGNQLMYETELEYLNFNQAVKNISNEYVDKFKENFINNPLKELKIFTYEVIYKDNENSIGHYYRNLYRLVKLIQSESFDTNKEVNENEKRKYRGILRAQLSSFELLMIFYNVVYSKKGENFKEILINTNFFDDHLIIDNFIWKNDVEELAKLDPTN